MNIHWFSPLSNEKNKCKVKKIDHLALYIVWHYATKISVNFVYWYSVWHSKIFAKFFQLLAKLCHVIAMLRSCPMRKVSAKSKNLRLELVSCLALCKVKLEQNSSIGTRRSTVKFAPKLFYNLCKVVTCHRHALIVPCVHVVHSCAVVELIRVG